jgi:hypothetical protein
VSQAPDVESARTASLRGNAGNSLPLFRQDQLTESN